MKHSQTLIRRDFEEYIAYGKVDSCLNTISYLCFQR